MSIILGALISAGISTAASLAGKGTSTAVNRNRYTEALGQQLEGDRSFFAEQDRQEREDRQTAFKQQNELSELGLDKRRKGLEEEQIGQEFQTDQAQASLSGASIGAVEEAADKRKSRLFGGQQDNIRRWGL